MKAAGNPEEKRLSEADAKITNSFVTPFRAPKLRACRNMTPLFDGPFSCWGLLASAGNSSYEYAGQGSIPAGMLRARLNVGTR